MFVCDNAHDIVMRYRLPYLPLLLDTDRIISIYVAPSKVAKASTIVIVMCCCHLRYRLKNIASVIMALSWLVK